jgi:phenylacetate-CoA ligase
LRGRQVDQVKIGQVEFSPFYLEEFLMRLPEVGNWYEFVVPPGASTLKVRVEIAPGVEKSPGLAERLASQMEFSVGVPCAFELVESIRRPKSKTIRVVKE